MNQFEIYFRDLSADAQSYIAKKCGYDNPQELESDNNWEIAPLAIFEVYGKGEEID